MFELKDLFLKYDCHLIFINHDFENTADFILQNVIILRAKLHQNKERKICRFIVQIISLKSSNSLAHIQFDSY